jgi:hypothetical protein
MICIGRSIIIKYSFNIKYRFYVNTFFFFLQAVLKSCIHLNVILIWQ